MKQKLSGGNKIFKHNDHLDLEIDIDDMPFKAKWSEVLHCRIKEHAGKGLRLDEKVHIVIAKKWRR